MSRGSVPDLPCASGLLALAPPHAMWWEAWGNPEGLPAVHLHGGPGAGLDRRVRDSFDLRRYWVVLYDQRGTGRSRPLAGTAANTTAHLVDDLERLRRHLGIGSWVVSGGSWGSALALAYAEAHPEAVRALVLQGVFLCRARETAWFLDGMPKLFPEHGRAFREHLPPDERDDPLAAYRRRLLDPDPRVRVPAARSWCRYERMCSTLRPDAGGDEDPGQLHALAVLEAHYFANRFFLPEGALLDGIAPVRRIPGILVHGRYDVVCPPASAFDLGRAWPEADLRVVADAGHAGSEPGIRAELAKAFRGLARDRRVRTGP